MSSASERGSATVLTLALVSVLLLGGFVVAAMTQLTLTRQQLATAADLAAIAAATSLVDPCTSAQRVTEAHGVRLVRCAEEGADWRIEVSAPIGAVAGRLMAFLGRGPHELTEVAVAGYQ